MKKNGKNIKCKNCNKEFYISESRFETRRYCSKFCSMVGIFKDFKQFEKKCVICGENFLIIHPLKIQSKTCSGKCHYGLVKKLSKKCYENKKNTIKKLNCKECKKQFNGQELYKTFYCSKQCQIENYKKSRIGKNNPAYRNGWSTRDVKKNLYDSKHLRACSKFKKKFIEKNGYIFCEVCKKSDAIIYNTHHIYYASRFPKHPKLHDDLNMIVVCIQCHNNFHSGKLNDIFLDLEKKRGLKKLFNTTKKR